ncbi:MAG TPA: hypothetical protein VGL56_15730 [Fimbriimonadaceae bacterium]|jgi:hypothetical protein
MLQNYKPLTWALFALSMMPIASFGQSPAGTGAGPVTPATLMVHGYSSRPCAAFNVNVNATGELLSAIQTSTANSDLKQLLTTITSRNEIKALASILATAKNWQVAVWPGVGRVPQWTSNSIASPGPAIYPIQSDGTSTSSFIIVLNPIAKDPKGKCLVPDRRYILRLMFPAGTLTDSDSATILDSTGKPLPELTHSYFIDVEDKPLKLDPTKPGSQPLQAVASRLKGSVHTAVEDHLSPKEIAPNTQSLIVPAVSVSDIIKSPTLKIINKPSFWSINGSPGTDYELTGTLDIQSVTNLIGEDSPGLLDESWSYNLTDQIKSFGVTMKGQDTVSTIPWLYTLDWNTGRSNSSVGVPMELGFTVNQEFENKYPLIGIGLTRVLARAQRDQTLAQADVDGLPKFSVFLEATGPIAQYHQSPRLLENTISRFHFSLGTKGIPIFGRTSSDMKGMIEDTKKTQVSVFFQLDGWLNDKQVGYQVYNPTSKALILQRNRTIESYASFGISYMGFRLGYSTGVASWAPLARQSGTPTFGYQTTF